VTQNCGGRKNGGSSVGEEREGKEGILRGEDIYI
jgi:hypothetical protein